MAGYVVNIEEKTLQNKFFRQVLFTGKFSQLVVMCLKPGEDIGEEVHDNVDQFFRIDGGEGKVIIEGEETEIKDGFAFVVPAGSQHNILNTSNDKDLQLYTIYSPPNHPDSTIHKTKEEAMAAEAEEHK